MWRGDKEHWLNKYGGFDLDFKYDVKIGKYVENEPCDIVWYAKHDATYSSCWDCGLNRSDAIENMYEKVKARLFEMCNESS